MAAIRMSFNFINEPVQKVIVQEGIMIEDALLFIFGPNHRSTLVVNGSIPEDFDQDLEDRDHITSGVPREWRDLLPDVWYYDEYRAMMEESLKRFNKFCGRDY